MNKTVVNQEFVTGKWHVQHLCPRCRHQIKDQVKQCTECGYSEYVYIGGVNRVCREVVVFAKPRYHWLLRWLERPIQSYYEVDSDFQWSPYSKEMAIARAKELNIRDGNIKKPKEIQYVFNKEYKDDRDCDYVD